MKRTKLKLTSGTTLSANLTAIQAIYQTELNAVCAETYQRCYSFFKDIKIPRHYKEILQWLATIGHQEGLSLAQGIPANTMAVTTALLMSLQYAAETISIHENPSAALFSVARQFVAAFHLDLKHGLDTPNLLNYCDDHQIAVPDEIQLLLSVPIAMHY